MNGNRICDAVAALSQETRLKVIRLLVGAGPEGLMAGAVADKLGISPSNASFHLKELERAHLIQQRRMGRSLIYTADNGRLREVISFLSDLRDSNA